MAMPRLRALLLGDDPDFLWTSLLVGIVALLPAGLLRRVLDGAFLVPGVQAVLVATAVLVLVFAVVHFNGGLLPVWIALFPSVLAVAIGAGGSGFAQPTYGALLIGAVLSTFVVGTVAHVIVSGAIRLWSIVRHRGGHHPGGHHPSEHHPGEHNPGEVTFTNGAASDRKQTRVTGDGRSRDDTADSVAQQHASARSIDRRTVLLATGGGVLGVLGVGFGYAYGWWCRTSPADCRVENHSGQQVALTISVTRRGFEVFHAESQLGPGERQRGVAVPGTERYDSAIPIGCALPEDVVVTVETDTLGSLTETVTFPEPTPPSGGGVGSSTLRIDVNRDGVEVEADLSYWVV